MIVHRLPWFGTPLQYPPGKPSLGGGPGRWQAAGAMLAEGVVWHTLLLQLLLYYYYYTIVIIIIIIFIISIIIIVIDITIIVIIII